MACAQVNGFPQGRFGQGRIPKRNVCDALHRIGLIVSGEILDRMLKLYERFLIISLELNKSDAFFIDIAYLWRDGQLVRRYASTACGPDAARDFVSPTENETTGARETVTVAVKWS